MGVARQLFNNSALRLSAMYALALGPVHKRGSFPSSTRL